MSRKSKLPSPLFSANYIGLVLIYFAICRVHDVDNNTKLDGLEILHAIQHTFHENRLAENDDYKEDMQDLPWIVGTFETKSMTTLRKDINGYICCRPTLL